MHRMRFLLCLVALWMLGVPTWAQETQEVNLGRFDTEVWKHWREKVPLLLPTWTGSLSDWLLKRDEMGLTSERLCPEALVVNLMFDNPHTDPNLIYRQLYPYPEIKPKWDTPPTFPYVLPPRWIEGVRRTFRWRTPNPSQRDDLERGEQVVWRWSPPEGWGCVTEPNRMRLNDRFAAVVLVHRGKERTPGVYRVVSFDAAKGERWTAPVPVWEALARLEALVGEPMKRWRDAGSSAHTLEFSQGVTRDGRYTLVVASCVPDERFCLLFVYDEGGRLVRTRVLPGFSTQGCLRRRYADSRFTLLVYVATPGGVSDGGGGRQRVQFLLTETGEVLGRFVRDRDSEECAGAELWSDEVGVGGGEPTRIWVLPRTLQGL